MTGKLKKAREEVNKNAFLYQNVTNWRSWHVYMYWGEGEGFLNFYLREGI